MLQLLLDEHISPAMSLIVRERRSEVLIKSLLEWGNGSLRGKDDSIVLAATAEAGYALVTFDLRTIPPLLKVWAEKGLSHQGVVFIDERTCRPQDFSAIADALIRIWDDLGTFEWTDRVAFASRAAEAN
jgi:hypothetical protein